MLLQNGECECKAGYSGHRCHRRCKPGFFGVQCAQKCECLVHYNTTNLEFEKRTFHYFCDSVTGKCLSKEEGGSRCPPGFTGENCEQSNFFKPFNKLFYFNSNKIF